MAQSQETHQNIILIKIFPYSNSDELLDDDESQDMSLPIQANTHLYCHMSNLDLSYCESELFDDKIKKYKTHKFVNFANIPE